MPDGALALVRHLARDPEPLEEQAILRDQLRSAYRAQDAGLLRAPAGDRRPRRRLGPTHRRWARRRAEGVAVTRTTEDRRAAYRRPWRDSANNLAARRYVREQGHTALTWRQLRDDETTAALTAEALGWARLTTTPSGAMWLQLTPEGVALAASGGKGT